MRTLLLLLAASPFFGTANATVAYVTGTYAVNPGPGWHETVTTSAINTTGASLIVIAVSDYATSGCPGGNYPDTIADSKSNSWTCAGSYSSGSTMANATLWYSIPTSVGSGHTFTVVGTVDGFAVAVFSGTAVSSVVDAVTGAGGNSSTLCKNSDSSVNQDVLVATIVEAGGDVEVVLYGAFTGSCTLRR